MTNTFSNLTRTLNREFKAVMPVGLKVKASGFGSFLSIRIDDPAGAMTVRLAGEIVRRAGELFRAEGLTPNEQPTNGCGYHMGGVVANWLTH